MTNDIKKEIGDILKFEGIDAMGFGRIPKLIMCDNKISLRAKAIYAYLCSFGGGENNPFPSRDKIMSDLNIKSTNGYYPHYKKLFDCGFITKTQTKASGNTFSRNIYTIKSNPTKYNCENLNTKQYQLFTYGGIQALGYGTISKIVMTDNRLKPESKALYAYFASFAGNGAEAFPLRDNILFHLNLNKTTYYKYLNELIKYNYITPVQTHENNFKENHYYLNSNPDTKDVPEKKKILSFNIKNNNKKDQCLKNEDTDEQCPKKEDTEESIETTASGQCLKKENAVEQCPKLQCPKKEYTVKEDTNTNSLNTNSLDINKIYPSIIEQEEINLHDTNLGWIDGFNKNEDNDQSNEIDIIQIIYSDICENRGIPYAYKNDKNKMTAAVHLLTSYEDHLLNPYTNGLYQDLYEMFNECLIEMATSDEINKYGTSLIPYSKVIDKMNRLIKFDNYDDTIDTSEWDIYTTEFISHFVKEFKERKIKNVIPYMKTTIWNFFASYRINYQKTMDSLDEEIIKY